MDAKHAWELLEEAEPNQIPLRRWTNEGSTGEEFTYQIRRGTKGPGIGFLRNGREVKSASFQRFEEFYDLWLSGSKTFEAFRNQGEKGTKAAVAHFLLPIFERLVATSAKAVLDAELEIERSLAYRQGEFDPKDETDARTKTLRSIVLRQGQGPFRRELLDAYDSRCAITDCDVADVLDAAHIRSYLGTQTNHVTNGLLLRTDIHALFDLGLIRIDAESTRILLAPALLATQYGELNGRLLRQPRDSAKCPNRDALRLHCEQN